MKADIYIHIGVHKTGTTSIQATFHKNRRRLRRHDINYLNIAENHSYRLYPLFCDTPHKYIQNLRVGIDNEAKAARKNAATARALRRALRANRCSGIVISGEALSSLSAAGVGRLKAALAPYAARFRVIAYVRDPYSYMTSAFQEHLREGADYDRLIAKPPLPRYRLRLARFIEVFGRDNVDIRIFDPANFVAGDLIADFLSAIDANPSIAADLQVIRRNEALSLEAAWLIKVANQLHPQSEKVRVNPARAVKLPHVLASLPGRRFSLPAEVYAAAAPVVEQDLQWLHGVLGRTVFSATPPAAPCTPRWDEETIARLAHLINELSRGPADWRHYWREAIAYLTGLAQQAPRLFGRGSENPG
ncbi:MAG TPA: hypothetical protein VG986_12120 [Pseudolabrys sp.]|nr:hypothetical protein [Pseudolabrys sp.]